MLKAVNVRALPKDVDAISAAFEEFQKKAFLELEIQEERHKLELMKRFARSSETLAKGETIQGQLFNELETETDTETAGPSETVTIAEHERKKAGRKPIPESYPRTERIHDLSEEQKRCPCCGESRPVIGKETSEEIEIIPESINVIRHVVLKYGPCSCHAFEATNEPAVIAATTPARLIPGSIASASLVAYSITRKFVEAVPFYRQEASFARIGFDVGRNSLCLWAARAGRALGGLIELMDQDTKKSPCIGMDETTVQVLSEPGRPPTSVSYMWVTVGRYGELPIIRFFYHPSRSKEVPNKILAGFTGYLQSDEYAGYNEAGSRPGIHHAGCWAHVRRKFFEASKVSKNANSARIALGFIAKLYAVEQELRSATTKSSDEFVECRRQRVMPILQDFHAWLIQRSMNTVPGTSIGKAINYALGCWERLSVYLETPLLSPDNNQVENAIRPFVVGRKNWLFSESVLGAHASATLYSVIETAKACGHEPYKYLKYIFEQLPMLKPEGSPRHLLPYILKPDSY
jgi:transposase